MNEIRRIRELTGLSMNKFSAKYHIPARTLQDWEYEKAEPAAYLVDLLERAVRADFGHPQIYTVVEIDSYKGCYEEVEHLETRCRQEAIAAADDIDSRSTTKAEKERFHTEIRLYLTDDKENYELVER